MERRRLDERIAADLQSIDQIGERGLALASAIAIFCELLASWARRMNLTAHHQPDEIARRLVLPPLIWSRLLPERPATIADIGSGAGLPGIPLALAFPEAEVVLVESRERRHHFQKHAIRTLGLSRVTAVLGRAEELEPERCQLGVAQAFSPIADAVFHVKRWTRPGGLVAIPQSAPRPSVQDPELEWIGCPEYRDPFNNHTACLWLSRKKS